MKNFLLYLIFGFVIILLSCAQTIPPIQGWASHYEIDNSIQTQEKENLTITLSPLNDLEKNKHPELFSFDLGATEKDWASLADNINYWFPPDASGKQYANIFHSFPAFLVSVKNLTGHILRMSDARIYLIIEGQEPVPAIANFGIPQFVPTQLYFTDKPTDIAITTSAKLGDGSLLDYICRFEFSLNKIIDNDSKYKNYPSYPFNFLTRVAIRNMNSTKLINEVGREILPNFSLNGILCFPYYMKKDQVAKVVFYDVVTETNEAGVPTKKTQFEFNIKYNPKYVKYNSILHEWEESIPPSM